MNRHDRGQPFPCDALVNQSLDQVDWSLTTWEGSRREQMRRWAQLTLEEILLAQEEMAQLSEQLANARTLPNNPDLKP
jgi:hypothetical protein